MSLHGQHIKGTTKLFQTDPKVKPLQTNSCAALHKKDRHLNLFYHWT